MSKRLVGLDIGTYSVKAVILDGREYSVLGWDEEKIVSVPEADDTDFENAETQVREAPEAPDGEAHAAERAGEPSADETIEDGGDWDADLPDWVSAARRLVDRNGFDEDLVATILPSNQALALQVDVPFADKNKVKSILPNLLTDRLPVNVRDVTFDFRIQGTEAQPRAQVAFAQSKHLSEFLDATDGLGVDPARICVPELVLSLAGYDSIDFQDGPVAVLDIGHSHTQVVVFEGREVLMARTMRTAGRDITESIAKAFDIGLDKAEKHKHEFAAIVHDGEAPNEQMRMFSDAIKQALKPLARDLRRSFRGLFARERIEISEVYICGGSAQIKNIDGFLRDELGLPVQRLNLPVMPGGAPSAVSYALGQTFKDGIKSHVLNLRQGAFAYRGRSSYMRRQLMIVAAVAFATIFVGIVALFLQNEAYEARRDAMRATLQKQTEQVFGEKLTKTSDIKRRLAGEDGAVKGFVPQMSAYELMYMVTSKISSEQDLDLRRFEVDIDRKLIQIMGETTDAQAVDKLVSDLENIECLKSIKKDKLNVGRDGRADFELQISTECS